MKKIKKVLSLLIVLCLLVISSSMATISFAEPLASQSASSVQNISAPIVPIATNSAPVCTIYTPQVLGEDEYPISADNVYYNNAMVYNTAVVFNWSTNGYGDELALSSNDLIYTRMGTKNYLDICFPSIAGDKVCTPQFKFGKNYSNSTGYSSYTTIGWEKRSSGGTFIDVSYSYECKYQIDGHYTRSLMIPYIPTEYDQEDFIWDHGRCNHLYGTIEYNGAVSDINVDVPWVGYRTATVTVGGVEFSLRTGPYKASIKANSSNAETALFNFAYAKAD